MSDAPLWTPPPERVARCRLVAFARSVRDAGSVDALTADAGVDYERLHTWSIEQRAEFWPAVWRFCGIVAEEREGQLPWDAVVLGGNRMAPPGAELGPRWFLGARLNFAQNLLRYADDREALVSWGEEGRRVSLTYAQLHNEVARAAAALQSVGVRAGDRVAGFLPNIPEAVIMMLATTSLGAIWSSCSPDFGVNGVLDRFGQIAPRVLVAADGYRYAEKPIDTLDRVRSIAASLRALEAIVIVPFLRPSEQVRAQAESVRSSAGQPAIVWDEWLARAAPVHESSPSLEYAQLPFDHPLYIMYSSGTTGLPKCMVHGAGGTLLQHQKEHVLHCDLGRDDRIFYYTTCGWMMWNWLVSALAVGSTVVLYDGAPLAPRPNILWNLAEQERLTIFGVSAKYLALSEKEGLVPKRTHHLVPLRAILSTGSPLAPTSFDYVYRDVKADVQLASISGGTDIISCFALGNATAPVWRGELQCRALGMAVEVFDQAGNPLRGVPGELVCTKPFPSMPVAFWNDPNNAKYHDAYFDHYPNVWRHGDWAQITSHGGLIITGRSDATLNPGGVRIGTAEIYRQVEQLPEIIESLVIGQEIGDNAATDVRIVLFVRLRDGTVLDEALRERIKRQIRENTSPHHVPKVIVQVADIPRTISGKITELAVRNVVHGRPVENTDALANPQALDLFRDLRDLRL
ncbi:MAG: acetoacetate--CoA ligase [Gemmatimonadaceae bacterium]